MGQFFEVRLLSFGARMRPARKIAWQGFEKMTNRRTDEDRPDPVTELTACLRRDGLTDEEIQRLVVKMGKMVAGSEETWGQSCVGVL